ncbi:MAG: glucuronate isomerase [Flavobacteriaceae bacterium]
MNKAPLIHENFLLENKYAQTLYHGHAAKLPIIDYHNHLSPKDLAENVIYENPTQVWINGDHYKWRAMRNLGIDEKYITGKASDQEKFQKWAYTVPYTMRNPLYHWTHMELSRYFDCYEQLGPMNADKVFYGLSHQLNTEAYCCRNLIGKMKVEMLCTTDDPTDSLEHHRKLAKSDFSTKVSMAFRPDKAIFVRNAGYLDYLSHLGEAADMEITTFDGLCEAIKRRMIYFHEQGCRLSDHGLEHLYAEDFTEKEVNAIFKKIREGKTVGDLEADKVQSALLIFLGRSYHELGWVQQFHLGAQRNNNSRMHRILGPDTGWDSIGDYPQAASLSKFLNALDSADRLTKTILYNVNPRDNELMATMTGNFNDGSIKGKVQWGSAWWFLDQKEGMTRQLNALSSMGLISCFIGMLTDSRSFLSFPRHEYFRRILCNLFGQDIEKGELPADLPWIGKLVQDICYYNAKEYFDF